MPFDGAAVSIISKELNKKLINARVMKIYQLNTHTIVLSLRLQGENRTLLISADPIFARIHMTRKQSENPKSPPAFCMLLRKHLEPSRIVSIEQSQFERIIHITFEAYDHLLGKTEKTIIFELMGRHSNIIFVDNKRKIIDAINRVYPEQSSVRQILPNITYQAPPNQDKVNPQAENKEDFITNMRLLPPNTKIYQGILQHYQGLGPDAAKEIVKRANLQPEVNKNETDIEHWGSLWNAFENFFTEIQNGGKPLLLEMKNKSDFFAYSLTGVNKQIKYYENLNDLLDSYYSLRIENEKVRQISSELKKIINTNLKRINRKIKLQTKALNEAAKADEWKKLGELVTANIYRIQKHDTEIEVTDYYKENTPTLKIPLDPALSPSENAQRYYKKYTKAKNSQKITKQQLQKARREQNYFEEVLVHINLADTVNHLLEIKSELEKAGYIKKKQRSDFKVGANKVGSNYDQYLSSDGLSIFVGRNNRQNDQLTFKVAKPDDIWLHAQKIPGSHVIIKNEGQIPNQTLEEAATLAAYYSKARTSPKVPVDYTARKHVRKPTGSKPGFVIYDNFESILVDPVNSPLPNKKRP